MSHDTERILALEREAEEHIKVIEELRTFARNVMIHGLRADLTPTMNARDDMYAQWSRYLQRIDTMFREQAHEALRRAKQLPRGNSKVSEPWGRWSTDPASGVEDVSQCLRCFTLVPYFSRDDHDREVHS